MPNLRYVPDPAYMARVARTAEVSEATREAGEAMLNHAQSIAPVVTGEYRGSFAVEEMGGQVFLVNTSDHAAAVEWGTSDTNQARHVLSRTADWLEGQ